MGKFAANNNESASIKLSPFFVFKGLYSCMNFDIVDFSNTNICKQIHKYKALNFFRNMKTTWEFV